MIGDELFICDSKYRTEQPLTEDLPYYFENHYICTTGSFKITIFIGKLGPSDFINSMSPIKVGNSCSKNDKIYFDKVANAKLLYAVVPLCSDFFSIKVCCKHGSSFILDFEIESSEGWLNFTAKGDSVITTRILIIQMKE